MGLGPEISEGGPVVDRGVLVCSVETVLVFWVCVFVSVFGFLGFFGLGGPGYRFGWWGPKYSLLSPGKTLKAPDHRLDVRS